MPRSRDRGIFYWGRQSKIKGQSKGKIKRSQPSAAPTGERVHLKSGRPVGRRALAFAVHAPSRGFVPVLRRGQPGMDAGLAAPGHGWLMAAGSRSRTGARACRAWARHRTKGARALWLLSRFSKVTRCKSETASRRYRRNGYAHNQRAQTKTASIYRGRFRCNLRRYRKTGLICGLQAE